MGASKKQCDELLEFIRHLAEDDKEGVMGHQGMCMCVLKMLLFNTCFYLL